MLRLSANGPGAARAGARLAEAGAGGPVVRTRRGAEAGQPDGPSRVHLLPVPSGRSSSRYRLSPLEPPAQRRACLPLRRRQGGRTPTVLRGFRGREFEASPEHHGPVKPQGFLGADAGAKLVVLIVEGPDPGRAIDSLAPSRDALDGALRWRLLSVFGVDLPSGFRRARKRHGPTKGGTAERPGRSPDLRGPGPGVAVLGVGSPYIAPNASRREGRKTRVRPGELGAPVQEERPPDGPRVPRDLGCRTRTQGVAKHERSMAPAPAGHPGSGALSLDGDTAPSPPTLGPGVRDRVTGPQRGGGTPLLGKSARSRARGEGTSLPSPPYAPEPGWATPPRTSINGGVLNGSSSTI